MITNIDLMHFLEGLPNRRYNIIFKDSDFYYIVKTVVKNGELHLAYLPERQKIDDTIFIYSLLYSDLLLEKLKKYVGVYEVKVLNYFYERVRLKIQNNDNLNWHDKKITSVKIDGEHIILEVN
jgi:hypothetical protein